MENFFLITGVLLFFSINIAIIFSDIRAKRIPNILLVLLIISMPLLFVYSPPIESAVYIGIQACLALITCYLLYYLGLWGAGDAKYLFVLSLYISSIGFITFIGNIAFITLIILGGNFIWFWVSSSLIKKQRTKTGGQIRIDIGKMLEKNRENLRKSKTEISSLLVYVILIFIFIRILRLEIIQLESIKDIFSNIGPEFMIVGIIIGTIFFISSIEFIKNTTFFIFCETLGFQKRNVSSSFYIGFSLLFLGTMIYIFIYDDHLYLIETVLLMLKYAGVFCIVKILIYMYKVFFIDNSRSPKDIAEIRSGDIIDVKWLREKLMEQRDQLFYTFGEEAKEKREFQEIEGYIKIIRKFRGGVGEDEIGELKTIMKKIKSDTLFVNEVIAYSPYIFLGFLSSWLFGNGILSLITQTIKHFFFRQ